MRATFDALEDEDPGEWCPVCLNRWGDIRHVPEWTSEHGRPVLTCNYDALVRDGVLVGNSE